MIWLGETRGNLSDWTTQRWVCLTGRRLSPTEAEWLGGPIGKTRLIGEHVFDDYAQQHALRQIVEGERGLLPNFGILADGNPSLANVASEVRDFYEHTSEYDLDAWSEWCSGFRPFGSALGLIFSRRLQQLNVPLSPMDSAKGMTSQVISMQDAQGHISQTAWVRKLPATGNVLYAGMYSTCQPPRQSSRCVKVVFPLPNGNAIVVMKAVGHADGSLSVQSMGDGFGDAGFYFTVRGTDGSLHGRYVKTMKEEIRVYPGEKDTVRADHTLWLWGRQFLRLHYRMKRRSS
ncbi:hypothetical protein [Terriglobus roseus]|uniref:Uncharacterized protein n=1 Tax=Terriglobus roseus TaxID=392734 RepID=A0A1G7FM62_9BACT|nr:hypothetical protein [Terriglobus roseus]SDE76934.1 hypothetical protein SAMN05444167_0386 [Terriglobus roseus]